jgi:hypothetical protein
LKLKRPKYKNKAIHLVLLSTNGSSDENGFSFSLVMYDEIELCWFVGETYPYVGEYPYTGGGYLYPGGSAYDMML